MKPVTLVVLSVASLATVAAVYTTPTAIPSLRHTSEYQSLADCSGVFAAASVVAQDDTEMSDTFTTASQYSLELAVDMSPAGVTAQNLSDMGFGRMRSLLESHSQDPRKTHREIVRAMDACAELLNRQIPITHRI